MKALRILGLAFALALISSIAHAQGVQRLCIPRIDATSGALSCIDASPANPYPVQPSYLFNNIATQTTTLVKTGAGVLHSVCVNTAASGAVITIYDSLTATGTKIGTLTDPAQGCIPFDAAFSTGLTVVTATASADITVSYR